MMIESIRFYSVHTVRVHINFMKSYPNSYSVTFERDLKVYFS